MNSRDPVVHKLSHPDFPSATEYFLPHPKLPTDVMDELHPWMQTVVTSDSRQIRSLLVDRWASIQSPELIALRDQILGYEAVCIVVRGKQVWLDLSSGVEVDTVGSSAYVAPPVDRVDMEKRLAQHGIQAGSLFHEFMCNFAGLAEDFYTEGNFIDLSDNWDTLTEEWREDIENFDDWKGSLFIYIARNADVLLLHSNGSVGWFKYAEGRITRTFESFSEFIEFYVNYRGRPPQPLDSYGPD
ncbi:MAG: hypothetical protein R3C28_09500 [Pirellulaceae bacterium]